MSGKVAKVLRRLALRDGKPLRVLKLAWMKTPAPYRTRRKELERLLGFKRDRRVLGVD